MLFSKKVEFNFTDMHIHILPSTDDGARDLKTSVAMLETAYEDGIRTMIVTPHFHPAKCRLQQEEILRRADELQDIAKQLYPDFRIYAGRELYYTAELEERIAKENLLMNGTRYTLVEFDFHESKNNIRIALNNILNAGLIPVLAHIERYYDCCGDREFAYNLKEMGVIIQINAGAILGDEGQEARRYVKGLLKDNIVDLVASDAHDNEYRKPVLHRAVQWIADRCGMEYAQKVARINPDKLITGEFID